MHESYLQSEQGLDSKEEFQQHQAQRARRGDKNAFDNGCVPFKHPTTNEPFTMDDVFDSKAPGYVYDSFVPVPPLQMREPPTFAPSSGHAQSPISRVKELFRKSLTLEMWLTG